MIGLASENGKPVVVEGGTLDVKEAELHRLTDDELRAMRKTFTAERMKKQKKFAAIADADKFATPAGSQAFSDIEYYNGIIWRVEREMQDRYIILD